MLLGAGARVALRLLVMTAVVVGGATAARAAAGECSQPVSGGDGPVASDCLFILRAAVGVSTCEPLCICAPTGGFTVRATDALGCLVAAVGQSAALDCACASADTESVTGVVDLPAGSTLDPATLTVATGVGDFPVDSGGGFAAAVPAGVPSFVMVVDENDDPLLFSFLDPGDVSTQTIGARSTGEALVAVMTGAALMQPEQLGEFLDLVEARAEIEALAAVIESELAADVNPLVPEESPVNAAVADALASILAGASQVAEPTASTRLALSGGAIAARYSPLAALETDASNILLSPDASTVQSGLQVLHNPDGGGVIVRNAFRRRSRLYLYKVGTVDDLGVSHPLTPPVQVGERFDIPSTVNLSAATSLEAIVGGAVPLIPITAGPLTLPKDGVDPQTKYKLVALGPTLDPLTQPAIFLNADFAPFVAQWDQEVDDVAVDTFMFDFLQPMIELAALGAVQKYSPGFEKAASGALRGIMDPFLLSRGLAIPRFHWTQYNAALQAILQASASGGELQAAVSGFNAKYRILASAIPQFEANLTRVVKTTRFLLVAELLIRAADAGSTLYDLGRSLKGDAWDATVIDRRVRIDPDPPTLKIDETSVAIRATVYGLPDEDFCFAWSLDGTPGKLIAAEGEANDGETVYTPEDSVSYFVAPGDVEDGPLATITVDVFPRGTGTCASQAPFDESKRVGTASVTALGEGKETECADTVDNDGDDEVDCDDTDCLVEEICKPFVRIVPKLWCVQPGGQIGLHTVLSTNVDPSVVQYNWTSQEQFGTFDIPLAVDGARTTTTYTAGPTEGVELVSVVTSRVVDGVRQVVAGDVARIKVENVCTVMNGVFRGYITWNDPPTSGGYGIYYACPDVPGATKYEIHTYKYQPPFYPQATTLAVTAPPWNGDSVPTRPANEHWAFCCGQSFPSLEMLPLVQESMMRRAVDGFMLQCEVTRP